MLEVTRVLTASASDLSWAELQARNAALAHLAQFPNDVITGIEQVGAAAGTIDFIPFRTGDFTVPTRMEAADTVDRYAGRVAASNPARYTQQMQNAANLGYYKPNWIFASECFLSPGLASNYFATRGPGGNPAFNYILTPSPPDPSSSLDIYGLHGQFISIPIVNKQAPADYVWAVSDRMGFHSLPVAAEYMGENQWFHEDWLDSLIQKLIIGVVTAGTVSAVAGALGGSDPVPDPSAADDPGLVGPPEPGGAAGGFQGPPPPPPAAGVGSDAAGSSLSAADPGIVGPPVPGGAAGGFAGPPSPFPATGGSSMGIDIAGIDVGVDPSQVGDAISGAADDLGLSIPGVISDVAGAITAQPIAVPAKQAPQANVTGKPAVAALGGGTLGVLGLAAYFLFK